MFSFLKSIFGHSIVKEDRGLDASENRQIAAFLARYFGTWREGVMTGDPVATGRWALGVMEGVLGVELLHEIANNAIRENVWPSVFVPGSEVFSEVAQCIGEVCRHLAEHGLPQKQSV